MKILLILLTLFLNFCVESTPTPSSALTNLISNKSGSTTYFLDSKPTEVNFSINSSATIYEDNTTRDTLDYVKGSDNSAVYEGTMGGDKMKITLSDITKTGGKFTLYNLQSLTKIDTSDFTWK